MTHINNAARKDWAACRDGIARRGWLAVLLVAVIVAPAAQAQRHSRRTYDRLSMSDLKTLQDSIVDVVEKVLPSTVAIRTYGGRRVLLPLSNGSGTIFRSNGYILTNYHVIEGAPSIKVILHNGAEYDAVVIQEDKRSDLAVLKIEADNLRAATFCNLSDVRIGHWAFAVGHPFGLSRLSDNTPSFTVGNISAMGRNLTEQLNPNGDSRYYGNLIETSATINPGNSGGALFNIDGDMIGVVTAIETESGVSEGLGFAIPISDRTRKIVASLEAGDEVLYGYLGVKLLTVEDGAASAMYTVRGKKVRGARIDNVEERGPARRAQLRADDVLIEFDGTPIENQDHLIRVIGSTPVGSLVSARYVRGRRERTTSVILAERPDTRAMMDIEGIAIPAVYNWRGAAFGEIPPALLRLANISPDDAGLLVVDVRPGSDAAKRGLERLQLVTSINGTRVKTLDQFQIVRDTATGPIAVRLDNDDVINFPRPNN